MTTTTNKENTMNNHDNDIAADWDTRTELKAAHPELSYDEIHTLTIDTLVQRQVEDLRAIASAIEATGIPVRNPTMFEPMVQFSNEKDVIRRQARIGVELIRAVHVPVDKITDDNLWGVKGELPSGIKVGYSIWNSNTCEKVPVLDDDGAPIMHTVTKLVSVDVVEAKTDTKCMTIFAADDAPADA